MHTPKQLTIGKVRGLQQIADAAGIFAMCAMDHRGSMQRLISKTSPDQVTYATLGGVDRVLRLELSSPEIEGLRRSAEILKATIASLKLEEASDILLSER